MNTLYFAVYNILLYPVFLFLMFFLSIFNKKIRTGLIGRFESIHILNEYFNQNNINTIIYWFHCSSYGEYLQVEQWGSWGQVPEAWGLVVRGMWIHREFHEPADVLVMFGEEKSWD